MTSSRGSSQPRDRTRVSHCRQILYHLNHQGSLVRYYEDMYYWLGSLPGSKAQVGSARGLRESGYLGVLCLSTDCLSFQRAEEEPGSFGKVWPFLSITMSPSGKDFPSLSLKDRWISLLEVLSNSTVLPYGFELCRASCHGCVSALARSWLWPLRSQLPRKVLRVLPPRPAGGCPIGVCVHGDFCAQCQAPGGGLRF